MILLLLSFLIPLSARGGKILQLNITELSFSYNLIVNIGGETRKYFEISLQTNFTFAASHNYKPLTFNKLGESYMSIKKEKDILFDILSSPLELILTNHSDDKIIIEDFNYYYYQGHLRRYDSFGFAYRMVDRKSSLLYQLYDMGRIDEVKFGFKMEKNNSKGYLFLGGVPEEKMAHTAKAVCAIFCIRSISHRGRLSSLPRWPAAPHRYRSAPACRFPAHRHGRRYSAPYWRSAPPAGWWCRYRGNP